MTEKWEYRNATRIYDESGLEVAQVSAERGLKTMRKRARLIAAAPELLEACIHAQAWADAHTREILQAAIAKTRGETE